MLENFTVGTFSGFVGDAFRVYPDTGEPLDLELVSATALGETSGRGRPFSTVFCGPGDVYLPQRIYRMEHAEMESFEIFLVPIGPDEKGLRYEAIFN